MVLEGDFRAKADNSDSFSRVAIVMQEYSAAFEFQAKKFSRTTRCYCHLVQRCCEGRLSENCCKPPDDAAVAIVTADYEEEVVETAQFSLDSYLAKSSESGANYSR